MIYYLYHICREEFKGNLDLGYIGITTDPQRRWKEHRRGTTNEHLKNAYEKYDDIIEYVVKTGTKEEILRLEKELRPENEIGWNITVGGGLPPNLKGHKWCEETQAKRTASLKLAWKEGRFPSVSRSGQVKSTSKPFVLISPEGEQFYFEALNKAWLEERGLNMANLNKVLHGHRKQHKGWICHYV